MGKMLLLLIASSIVGSAPVSAAQYLIDYRGTVSDGGDSSGLFGSPGQSLVGDSFSLVFTLTYPKPGAQVQMFGGQTVFGQGLSSPLSAVLTINNHPFYIAGSDQSTAGVKNQGWKHLYDVAIDTFPQVSASNYVSASIISYIHPLIPQGIVAQTFSYTVDQSNDAAGGGFSLFYVNGQLSAGASGSLAITDVTETRLGVAEPSSLAAMLGVGCVTLSFLQQRRSRDHNQAR